MLVYKTTLTANNSIKPRMHLLTLPIKKTLPLVGINLYSCTDNFYFWIN
jgi:hypothetical protein